MKYSLPACHRGALRRRFGGMRFYQPTGPQNALREVLNSTYYFMRYYQLICAIKRWVDSLDYLRKGGKLPEAVL
jgi:hypothetical protein